MKTQFPLFNSHLDLAHHLFERLLQEGDCAIDATCGNGHDTLKLAQILLPKKGTLLALDIQEEAIHATKARLAAFSPEELSRVHFTLQSHVTFPDAPPPRLIVYNLGYLPGGNKALTTRTETTLLSLQQATQILLPGGAILITCYPGHPEGAKEEEAVGHFASKLPPMHWGVSWHQFPNRHLSPSLFLLQKTSSI